eukprot:gene759-4266_t
MRAGALAATCCAARAAAACPAMEAGVSYSGNDVSPSTPAASAEDRCALCTAEPACLYFTWCSGTCWRKSAQAGRALNDCVSGAAGTPSPNPSLPGARPCTRYAVGVRIGGAVQQAVVHASAPTPQYAEGFCVASFAAGRPAAPAVVRVAAALPPELATGALAAVVRPLRLRVRAAAARRNASSAVVSINVTGPMKVSVEIGAATPAGAAPRLHSSPAYPLLLFADGTPALPPPDPADQTAVVLGPGLHDVGAGWCPLNATTTRLHIAAGALVRGALRCAAPPGPGVRWTVDGRGVLSGAA